MVTDGAVVVGSTPSLATVEAEPGAVVTVPVVSGEAALFGSELQPVTTRPSRARKAMRRRTWETVGPFTYMRSKSSLSLHPSEVLYNSEPVPAPTLYFAYGALLDPDRIAEVAPDSKFLFTAHFPETKLGFVDSTGNGIIPTLTRQEGHTVWGGVFEIPEDAVDSLIAAEKAEGRQPGFDAKAVDRAGNKYECLTFVAASDPLDEERPSAAYLESMINGARHWSLPAGWIMGLEDLSDDPLFS